MTWKETKNKTKEEMPKKEEKRIAIEGMKLLDGSKTMPSKTGLVNRGRDESKVDKKEVDEQEFNDTDVKMKKASI
jgi:hypothetical protein